MGLKKYNRTISKTEKAHRPTMKNIKRMFQSTHDKLATRVQNILCIPSFRFLNDFFKKNLLYDCLDLAILNDHHLQYLIKSQSKFHYFP